MMRSDFPLNAFRICIHDGDLEAGDIRGLAYTPLELEAISFNSLTELILRLDQIFDREGYPQAFQEKRSFGKRTRSNSYQGQPDRRVTSEEIREQAGNKATYDIVVTGRRNASWQGMAYNLDGQLLGKFQGELELLGLIA